MNKISIIVPVYKTEPYLRKCVDSILAQTHPDLEVILVDDGSPDHSGQICDEYAVQDPRVRVIHKPNGGLSDARNAGLDICTGDYIGFVDSDDWIEPTMYGTLLEMLLRFDADMAFGGVADELERDGTITTFRTSDYGQTPFSEDRIAAMHRYFHGSWAAWDKLYRAELFRDIRYPVGEINEDEAIALHLLEKCDTVCYTNEVCYHYMKRISSGSITMAPFTVKDLAWKDHCAANLRYVREHHPELEQYAAIRYRSSLMWHITKASLLDDCSMYETEIRQLMAELKSERKLFDRIPMDTKKLRAQYLLATRFGFKAYRTILRLKQGR